uniref:Uncharacterized protein n=1 Tax=Oryza brachyantha TaxID=4533 RepID=J3LKD0_ORYBR
MCELMMGLLHEGAGPSDDSVNLLDGGARRREAGGRRGLLRAAAGRGAVGAVELERRHGGGDPARADGVLQPAERPPRPAGGLAADQDPVPRRGGDVLGDHHLLQPRRLPRRRRRLPPLHGAPRPLRRRRARRPRRHADGGVLDPRRRRVQRAGPRPRRLHPARGGQADPLLRRHGRRQVTSHNSVTQKKNQFRCNM